MLFLPTMSLGQNVVCFTTSIHGGVSNDEYQSFNLGDHVGDNSHRVNTNRQLLSSIILQQALNRNVASEHIMPIKWLNQQHTNLLCDYNQVSEQAVDGVYARQANTPLVIMTADCLPIVMCCQQTGQIAAVHAGWRGLANNIIANAIDWFDSPADIKVWIGPSISQTNFEVSADLLSQFNEHQNAIIPSQNDDKYLLDLAAIAVKKLQKTGIVDIENSMVCTYSNRDCFSHRRMTHQGFAQTGRMATVIIHLNP